MNEFLKMIEKTVNRMSDGDQIIIRKRNGVLKTTAILSLKEEVE